ncbi:NIN-like protein [Artemisia annua]|uniref:NIN-like protein n=1 Tax=Artemisia annua TaxID=35608 RepID=A0A2U1M118_ARTAN|nr:NIN-like protein [Artemisia annua]
MSDMAQMKDLSLEPPAPAVSGETRYLTRLWVSQGRSSQSAITTSGLDKIIQDKIRASLKLLTFREPKVLVQFWSTRVVGKQLQLTTVDQPYGLGAIDDRLNTYRRDSDQRNFYVVDKDHEEEFLISPPARVFRQRLPEWTPDITNYNPKDFPQQECAIRCNLHGYLALPVFDSTTGLCVGVIELLASSNYTSFADEVHQFQRALKSVNLTTKLALDSPALKVHNEHRDNNLEKIFSILKDICETNELPLAQTWAMSPLCSFTSHEQMLKKSCNSFNTRCLGKSCMSTAGLPFYVRDLSSWRFWEACRERYLDKSCGFVGRALLSHDLDYCEDVTKLSEEEYPLGSYARMCGLTSCFAIFLDGVESNDGYVVEFFLSPTQVDGPPTKTKTLEMVSSDSGYWRKSNPVKRGQKRKIDNLTVEAVSKHLGKPIDEAAKSLDGNWSLAKHNKKTAHVTASKLSQNLQSSNILFGLFAAVFLLVCSKHSYLPFESDPIYQAARLMVYLNRWKNKKSTKDVIQNRDHLADLKLPESSLVYAPPKQIVVGAVSDATNVTVIATFNDDRIKFRFPTSSGLVELEKEVAQRIGLKGKRLRLKYRDEDDDLILLTCDADLHNLLGARTNSTTIKLIIVLLDE